MRSINLHFTYLRTLRVPLEFVNGAWVQNTRMIYGLPGKKNFTISLAVWIQFTSVADGRTPADISRPTAFLRTASRGKN